MKTRFIPLFTAMIAISSTAALAKDMSSKDHDRMMKEHFKKVDADSDSFITKDEWNTEGDRMFAEQDSNGDGKISMDEMKAFKMAKKAEWKEKHGDVNQKSSDHPHKGGM